MRQKRSKIYRKLMDMYSMTFGFRQPYQVLVDSEMCKLSVSSHMDLVKQISHVLHGEVKPMITQCCIHELYLQGKDQQGAVDLAKLLERRKCNHREAIPGEECLRSVVGESNKHRYVIATQSQPLRSNLRAIPAVPLVHVNRAVMVLEPPSDTTLSTKQKTEENALKPSGPDLALLPKTVPPPKKKRKGPKGPNPLSVKNKKKAPPPLSPSKSTAGEKRKREGDYEVDEALKVVALGGNRHGPIESTSHQLGRKRKRRRKGTDAGPVTQAEEEIYSVH